MQSNTKKRVGILRGGKMNSRKNYQASLQKGGEVIVYLLENLADKYKPIDILIDTENVWHLNGVPIIPSDLMHKVDIVWNLAHPTFSTILESFSIPYISTNAFAGSLEESRDMLAEHMRKIDIQMPRHIVIPVYQQDFDGSRERYAINKAKEIHEKWGSPWIVKSFTEDKGMGVHVAQTFGELVGAIEDGANHEKSILVEEFIMGNAGSVHTLGCYRGEDTYVMPMGNFSAKEKETVISLAKILHEHLGAEHYLKSDFILHPNRGVFLTEINFSPDLRKDSHLEQSGHLVGAKMKHMVEHMLESVL